MSGCRSAPITQRKQLLIFPENYETSLGISSYDQILVDEPASTNQHYIDMVNRVGQRIAAVAERPDYQWEFRVIASEKQNAFALPGGKVAIYEGILPICMNEAGLAVVMSHEIGHVLARHGGERMSQGTMVNAVGSALKYMTQGSEQYNRELVLGSYGAASKYGVLLPFSRKHESEADHIGLLLMSKAGYDPTVAPAFWDRFSASQGPSPAEFMSTHPASARRAMDLRALMQEATALYEQAPVKHGVGETIQISQISRATPTNSTPPHNRQSFNASPLNSASADALPIPNFE